MKKIIIFNLKLFFFGVFGVDVKNNYLKIKQFYFNIFIEKNTFFKKQYNVYKHLQRLKYLPGQLDTSSAVWGKLKQDLSRCVVLCAHGFGFIWNTEVSLVYFLFLFF